MIDAGVVESTPKYQETNIDSTSSSIFNEQQIENNTIQKSRVVETKSSKDEINLFQKEDEILHTSSSMKPLKKLKRPIYQKANIFLKYYLLNIKDIIVFCLSFYAILLYYNSLTPCSKTRKCYWGFFSKQFFRGNGMILFTSILYFSLFFFYTLYTKKYLFHYIYIIPSLLYFFMSYKGTNSINHGTYNAFFFLVLFVFFVFSFTTLAFVYYLLKKKKYITLIAISTFVLIFYILYNSNVLLDFSCDKWDLGLNNTRIMENDRDYACTIKQPGKNKCYMYAMEGWFNFSKIIGQKCNSNKERKNERALFDKSVPPQFKNKFHFGYPITNREKFNLVNHETLQMFQEYVLQNIIDMEKYNKGGYLNEPKPEVELRFDPITNKGTLDIHLNKNETLAKERKELEKNSTSLYPNILIIYLDAVSRQNFFRKLKNTVKFLEQFTRYDPDEKTKNFTVFQFMKYHTLKAQTIANVKPMFYGASLKSWNGTNLVKWMKEQGYVTGHTQTSCGREIFSVALNKNPKMFKDLDYDSWDHENIAMFCDNNFFTSEFFITRGASSMFQRCLYGTNTFNYAINYTLQFWDTYKDNKKFFRIHINDAHEGSNSVLSYFDDALYNFIKNMYETGKLENTFVFIMSDHGIQLGGPWLFIHPKDLIIERTLGTLFLMVPNEKKLYENGWFDNLIKNQQTFVTPYDIYDTILHIGTGNNSKYEDVISPKGQTLFSYVDETQRYCENPNFMLGIERKCCQCKIKKEKKEELKQLKKQLT